MWVWHGGSTAFASALASLTYTMNSVWGSWGAEEGGHTAPSMKPPKLIFPPGRAPWHSVLRIGLARGLGVLWPWGGGAGGTMQ